MVQVVFVFRLEFHHHHHRRHLSADRGTAGRADGGECDRRHHLRAGSRRRAMGRYNDAPWVI